MTARSIILGVTLAVAPCASGLAAAERGDDVAVRTFSQSIPANEIRPLEGQAPRTAHDQVPACGGTDAGVVCTMAMENFRLTSSVSTDGGVSFGPEVLVAGGSLGPDVFSWDVEGYDAGILIAMMTADPGGNRALQVTRSADFCSSWDAPRTVVSGSDASAGVRYVQMAVNNAGRWAILYYGGESTEPWVVTSDDDGFTWTTPVPLVTAVEGEGFPVQSSDVAIDSTGVIYATFVQDWGYGPHVFYTRSTDGGATFEAERDVADLPLPETGGAHMNPRFYVPDTDEILLAFWDALPEVYVLGSADRGQNYGVLYSDSLTVADVAGTSALFPDSGQQIVFMLTLEGDGRLWLHRSEDSGQSWDPAFLVTTTAWGTDAYAIKRTPAGKYVLVWSDSRADPYAGMLGDIYMRVSSNNGASWGAEQRVNSGAVGETARVLGPFGVTSTGTGDEFLVCYRDAREQDDHSADIYANRGVAGATSAVIQPDQRIDLDSDEPIARPTGNIPAVATDGVASVYLAFPAIGTGPYLDILISRSLNGGYTFFPPQRVGDTVEGDSVEWFPTLAALPDGHVYLAYIKEDGSGGNRRILFSRSENFGYQWSTPLELHAYPWIGPHHWDPTHPAVQISTAPGGVVHVVYSDGETVYLSSSGDYGASFAKQDIDQNDRGYNRIPRMCVDDEQIVVVFHSTHSVPSYGKCLSAAVSENAGADWAVLEEIRPLGAEEVRADIALACGPNGQAVAFWSQEVIPGVERDLRSIRYDGSAWGGIWYVPLPPVGFPYAGLWPSAAYTSETTLVVAHEVRPYGIFAARSLDGGATWGPGWLELDDGSFGAAYFPQVVSDGAGKIWVSWMDERAGQPSIAMRYSPDGGASYFTTYRMDRKLPQGAHRSHLLPTFQASATLPGVGFTIWAAQRDNPEFLQPVLNAWDSNDLDRDTSPDATDCLFYDPSAFAPPVEVEMGPGYRIDGQTALFFWIEQAGTAGSGTVYDVVTGRLADLRATHDFSAASCLQSSLTRGNFEDARLPAPGGEGDYYLIRARNSCGLGVYGDSSLSPDPRDALEGWFTPCP